MGIGSLCMSHVYGALYMCIGVECMTEYSTECILLSGIVMVRGSLYRILGLPEGIYSMWYMVVCGHD